MIYCILLISILYAVFIIWLFEGLRAYQSKQKKEEQVEYPFVSVIVSARNEENTIEDLLTKLYQQTYPHDKFEIIIANDRSTDSTERILKKHSEEKNNLFCVSIKDTPIGWAPKKWALHTIIQKSAGEILLQTDADCKPAEKWIETIALCFNNENIGMVSAPAPLIAQNRIMNTLFELESLAQDGFSAAGFSYNLIFSCTGRNIAIRKSVFEEINGYDGIEHFISGDDDLLLQKVSSKTGYEISFLLNKDALVESSAPTSIPQFISQRLRFASKGLEYYKISTSNALKLALPLLYITNIAVVISIIKFTETAIIIWLLPWIIKLIPDALLTSLIFRCLERKWNTPLFMVLSLIHPFYVSIFGAVGPFKSIQWKNEYK